MSPERLMELLLNKGRKIISTCVPQGYSITADGRDPDVTQVAEATSWDNQTKSSATRT